MKPRHLISNNSGLLVIGFGMLSVPIQLTLAADGVWIGSLSNVAPNGVYTNTANWQGGTMASGTDATASFVFDPVSDAGGTVIAGGLIFDANQTLGNLVFNDTNGYGSATIGFNQATAGTPLNLTLDTTIGTPTITTGQLLNSISGGKKVVINHNLLGNDGLTTNGPGFLGLRGSLGTTGATTSTLSGALNVDGGLLQLQSQLGSITSTTVRNGSTLFLDFSTSGAAGTNRINAASTLVLGGAGGSGVILNANAAATANHSQTFAGVTLNAGAHQVIAATNTNQNVTYNLGTITPTGKATLNLAKPTAAGAGVINLANTNANGILGGWATFNGGDWAINNGSGAAAAFAAYTSDTWAANTHTNVTRSQSLAAATTGTLRFNNGIAFKLELSGANTIETGGLISSQQSPLITSGSITSGTSDFMTHVAGGVLRIASTITDNGAGAVTLVKSLTGSLQLEGNMTYSGGTVIGAGTVTLGKGPLGGTTGNLGTGDIVLSANNTGNGSYNPSGTLAFNRSGTYTLTNAVNPTVNGGGYLAMVAGSGTLVLNQGMKVGGFIQQAGTTRLDFNAASAPTSQIIDGAFVTGPTTLHTGRLLARNGSLEILGKDGATTEQNFALTEILGGVTMSLTPGAAGSATLSLGAFSRPNNSTDGGGTLAFMLPAGTAAASNFGTASSLIADAGTAFVTVNGNDWGAKDAGNTMIVAGSTLPGFYTATTGAGLAAATNVDVTMNDSVTGSIQTGSVRFAAAAATAITINSGGSLLPGGILVGSNAGANVTTISGPGDLRSAAGNRDLPIIQNNPGAPLVIAAPIVNNAASNTTNIVKSGIGTVEFTAANTYTGRTFVNEGTLRLAGTAQLGTSTTRTGSIFGRGGELVVQENAKVFTSGFASFGQRQGENATLSVSGNGVFDISADFNIGDVNARGVLNISDNASLVVKSLFVGKGGYSEGTINQTGGTLTAGNTPTADWNLGGNGAADTAAIGTYNLSGGTFNPLGQNFQVGRNGTGIFNLSGSGLLSGTGYHVIGRFHSANGTVNLTDNGTWNANPGGAGQAYLIVGETGTGTLNVGGGTGTPVVTAKNLSIAHNGGAGVVNQTGGIVDLQATTAPATGINAGVVFGATNTPGLTLPNYGGTYNLAGGVLRTFGVGENTGIVTPVSSTFNFAGGTLQAIGNNPAFMSNLDLAAVQAGGARIDTGSYTITIAQQLQHDAGLGATPDGGLTKKGSGSLIINGTCTYTGLTTVSEGTLLVNGNLSLATGATQVEAGAVLGGTGTLGGGLTVLGNGTLAPGASAGTLTTLGTATFANSSILNFELNGGDQTVGGGVNDLFTGITTLTLDGTLNITEAVANSFALATSGSWRLMDYTDTLIDNGLTLGTMPTLPSGYSFQVDTTNPGQVNLIVIPEPGVITLLGGFLTLLGLRRRR